MSTLNVSTIKSFNTSPPAIQNSSGTEIGTFCRAWVNFNGTGTVAIRASFNVTSITDNGTGDYTVNFTNAMPDANYVAVGQGSIVGTDGRFQIEHTSARTVNAYRLGTINSTQVFTDTTHASVSFFR